MEIIVVQRSRSCPFGKRSLPFLRHSENFWPVIETVSIKKKENRMPTSNLDLEPEPFVPHQPAKISKKLSKYTS